MAITTAEFDFIRDLVRGKAGIVLETGKEYLVDARITSLIKQENIPSFGELIQRMKRNPADPIVQKVVEAMTTNETSFFRDRHPFDALKNTVLPALLSSRAPTRCLSIWCGAASTGQEPYTIAMMLHDAIPQLAQWKVTFLATDISSEMIARSRAGKYNQIEINRGLPATHIVKYFEKHGLEWQIKPHLRQMVDYREMNLMQSWLPMPPLDIVFMRNVLIYFDTQAKKEILGKIKRLLRPDGYLFLGCAETTMGLDDGYQRLPIEKSGCYRHREAVAEAA
jgi:chemotaxis protein methyltransferase CheR